MLVVPASERRTGTVLLVAAKHGRGERGWTKGKTQISLPFPSLDGILCAPRFRRCAHTWRSTAFSLHPSSPLLPPLVHPYALLRRYTIGQHRQMHMHLRMENWWRGKKKITTEQTIRVTWTTATNNVGLVNELSRQKLQLLRVQEVWEPGKWIPCRPMTRDGRENNC